MFKGFFRHARRNRHAVYLCLKEVQKPFRCASVLKNARFDTRVSVFKTRGFRPSKEITSDSPAGTKSCLAAGLLSVVGARGLEPLLGGDPGKRDL